MVCGVDSFSNGANNLSAKVLFRFRKPWNLHFLVCCSITLSVAKLYSVEWRDDINGRSDHGPMKIPSRHFYGGTEENHKNARIATALASTDTLLQKQ
jgi:hypothetical protein